MFTLDSMFVISMQQRHGVSSIEVTTKAKHSYTYLNEQGKRITVMKPVLIFTYCNARVEKAMPMEVKAEWITGSAGIAMKRVFAECTWGANDIEKYIEKTAADLRDNMLVKGHA